MINQSCQCDECQVNRRQEPDTTHYADDATLARIAELERENAELRKDAERLNHVERHGCWQVTHDEWRPRTDGTNIRDRVTVVEGWIAMDGANDDLIKPTLREAIDAAMKKEVGNG